MSKEELVKKYKNNYFIIKSIEDFIKEGAYQDLEEDWFKNEKEHEYFYSNDYNGNISICFSEDVGKIYSSKEFFTEHFFEENDFWFVKKIITKEDSPEYFI